MQAAGLPECASCHSNHAITVVEEASLSTLCADCHGENSDAWEVGRQMEVLIASAREQVQQAEVLALQASEGPVHVEDYLSRLEEARTHLTEAAPLVHSVSVQTVESVTRRARSIAEEVQHELYEKLDRTSAHLILALTWFYLLVTLAILIAYKRRLRRRDSSG
jgi:Fe2+ transport system protein B